MQLTASVGARIGRKNEFICGLWTKSDRYKKDNYARRLELGANSLITSGHHFDVAGAFVLGARSWSAGTGSQFWTHGAGVLERNINIGSDCYVGSAVRFSPGSSIGDNCIIGLGSVLTKTISVSNAMIAGYPARVIRENYDWKTRNSFPADTV
jgi:acetyltransferase-like isoleucine patch superfamily enzyme